MLIVYFETEMTNVSETFVISVHKNNIEVDSLLSQPMITYLNQDYNFIRTEGIIFLLQYDYVSVVLLYTMPYQQQ